MKKASLLLAVVMLLSMVGAPAFAEDSLIKESASGFYYIEESGDQPRLSATSMDMFIQAEGLYFKDLNSNGELDVYEDWRAPVADRVNDLLSQMTMQEKAGTLFFSGVFGKVAHTVTDFSEGATVPTGIPYLDDPETALYSHNVIELIGTEVVPPMANQIQDMYVTTYIADLTGMPEDQLELLNAIQALSEDTRLGIPTVIASNRSYSTWGGLLDMAHYAFGVAHDEELLYNLVSEYAKENVVLGRHQVLHGYGNEIGAWYGDEVNYIARMSEIETRAYEDNDFNTHSKHFIARGGRSNFMNAKSPANLWESYMVGWQAVVDAGTPYIMTNLADGLTPGVITYMDSVTYGYLRNELGYEGVVVLDWPQGMGRIMGQTGITADGVDISTLTAEERYALILNAGVDMFSALGVVPGTVLPGEDDFPYAEMNPNYPGMPDVLLSAIENGLVTEADFDVHVSRVLKNKFDLGIFENPYADLEDALAFISNGTYTADAALPMNDAELNAYRRDEIIELEKELMVKSSILMKNDDVLPLAQGAEIFFDSPTESIKEAYLAVLPAYATVVDDMADADYVVIFTTAFDDAYEYMVEDAQDAGKPVILVCQSTITYTTEPGLAQVESAAAILMQTYNNTPDHGSSVGSFYRYVTPSVTADMLFGVEEPGGSTVYEIGYDLSDYNLAWGDLQLDIGVDNATRLYMAMLARENPTIEMPNNLGDVLYTTNFGMDYSTAADIEISLLTVSQYSVTTQTENNGRISTTTELFNTVQQAGVPFEINFVAKNNGGDGHVTVDVLDGTEVIAQKFVALDAGQFRVITMDLTLEAGEHEISVNGMTTTIIVE